LGRHGPTITNQDFQSPPQHRESIPFSFGIELFEIKFSLNWQLSVVNAVAIRIVLFESLFPGGCGFSRQFCA
jgi:hypothetical protein